MEDKINTMLSEIRPEFNFKDASNFIDEGFLDSFDIIQLVTALDDEFNISIDGSDILPENFSTIDSIIELLTKNGITT